MQERLSHCASPNQQGQKVAGWVAGAEVEEESEWLLMDTRLLCRVMKMV